MNVLAMQHFEKAWKVIFLLAITVFTVLLLQYHVRVVLAPIPLDYYEGTMPLITGIIAEGNNPYTRAFQPAAMDVYPPLYNIVVAPFTWAFGNSLQLHRAVSAFFIFLSCGLCVLAAYRSSRSLLNSFAAGACIYAGLLFYSTPVASTNALGIFFYLSALIGPWLFNFSNRSLVFALACGLLAFYTKQYFVIAMAILCLYVFLYHSKLKGILLGLAYAVMLVGSLTLVHLSSPYYLDNTLFAAGISIYLLLSSDTLLRQIVAYLQIYWPLLVLVLVAFLQWLRINGLAGFMARLRSHLDLEPLQLTGPLLSRPVDYFAFCFVWATIATMVSMGRNPGNFMTYLFQLMSPFLLIAGFKVVTDLQSKVRFIAPLVLVVFYQVYTILPRDFSNTEENWAKVDRLVKANDEILASQMLLMTLIKHDKQVYQDGHTFYFPIALQKPQWFVKEREEDRVEAVWKEYLADIYHKIENQEFDLIMLNTWDFRGMFGRNPPPDSDLDGKTFLKQFYYLDEKFPLSMTERHGGGTYGMMVWRPKTEP